MSDIGERILKKYSYAAELQIHQMSGKNRQWRDDCVILNAVCTATTQCFLQTLCINTQYTVPTSNDTCCYVDNYHCTRMYRVQMRRLVHNRLTVIGLYPIFYLTCVNEVLGRFGLSNLHRFGCKFVQLHNFTSTTQSLHYQRVIRKVHVLSG